MSTNGDEWMNVENERHSIDLATEIPSEIQLVELATTAYMARREIEM